MEFRKPEEDKLRAYPILGTDGPPYWGITSIKKYVFGLPQYLNRWSVKIAVMALIEAEKKKKLTQKEKLEIAQAARKEYLESAGTKGTAVHDAAEHKLRTGKDMELEEAYQPYYQAFLRFQEEHKLTPILQEEVVYSHKYRFAGRFDFYGEVNGKKVLLDFKTSKYLDADFGLQLAAYRYCLEHMGNEVEGMFIVHLKENGTYELREYYDTFEDFLNLLNVFNWKIKHDRPEHFWATNLGTLEEDRTAIELDPKRIKKYESKVPKLD